ncbi:MAG: site-specific DNA-methyltransferase [Synergistaceae bacterium]|jgi:DNA modification methylase|nr:site-specific DNA-methyltransferase [Synergistaceae bacterium]
MTAYDSKGNGYFSEVPFVLEHDDATNFTKNLSDGSVQLVVTSPPYNVGKSYERRLSMSAYIAERKPLIGELVRVLSERGSICWEVGNYVHNGEVLPLDICYYEIFKEFGLKLRNRIVWHFGHGLHASKRFSGRYETILWFTKTDDYTFNLDDVRVPSKYPSKRHYKGDKKGELSGNPLGKNPSDFWDVSWLKDEWEGGVWEIPNVKANHPEKTSHPCQFPVELAERCVLALTNEGDVVFDPYAGVASALIAAVRHGRRAIGVDLCEEYVKIGRERLSRLLSGNLVTRPMGRPIHVPTQWEKTAQFPIEWMPCQRKADVVQ